jgi:hypothetical protein
MAETLSNNQGNEKDLKAPEGDFKEWDEDTSKNGQTYYTRDVDTEGNTVKKPKDVSGQEVNSHGPSFSNVPCYWTPGTSGSTSADFANQTGITWYKLDNSIGWTYQLTINTTQSYNYTFNTPAESYGLNVIRTWTTHEVTYTTYQPNVTSVSGK